MALGQAAGVAACMSIEDSLAPRKIDVVKPQHELVKQKAVLIYLRDVEPGDAHYEALQFFALRGFYRDSWQADLNRPVPADIGSKWITWAAVGKPEAYVAGKTT